MCFITHTNTYKIHTNKTREKRTDVRAGQPQTQYCSIHKHGAYHRIYIRADLRSSEFALS